MNLVDSHCHLDDEKFQADFEGVLTRAAGAGVRRMLAIGTGDGPPDLECAIRLAAKHPEIFATVGVHPHSAAKATNETLLELRRLVEGEKVLALGEIGLDYHYDFSPRDVQREIFVGQMLVAKESRMPIIIHTREAWDETIALIRAHAGDQGGIFHCFTGDAAQAREALDLGFHLSFGGMITFPKADAIRESARLTPDDRLLVETDAPYLAPAPHRGKRNEPAFMVETVRRLAELRGAAPEHIAAITTRNFERLCLVN